MAETVNNVQNINDALRRNFSLPTKCCCRYELMTGIKWIFGLRFGVLLLIILVGLFRDFGLALGIDNNPHRANATVVNGTVVDDYQEGDTISIFPLVTCFVFLAMELVLWFGTLKKSPKALMAWLIYAGIIVLAAIPILLSAFGQGLGVAIVPLLIFIPHVYSMLIVCSVRNLILQGKWPESDSDHEEEEAGEDEEQGKPPEAELPGEASGGQPPATTTEDPAEKKRAEANKPSKADPSAPSQPQGGRYVFQPMASRQPIPSGYVYQPMSAPNVQPLPQTGGYVPPSDLSRLGQQINMQARFAQPAQNSGLGGQLTPSAPPANNEVPDLPPPSYEDSTR